MLKKFLTASARSYLRGAWLRLRAATLNPASDRRVVQVRLILNWALPLL